MPNDIMESIKFKIVFLVFVLFFLDISLVSGFGFGPRYYKENPLKMAPGETVEVELGRLQNIEERDVVFRISLVKGEEIATLMGSNLDNFIVPAKTTENVINISVSIPENAKGGDSYLVQVKFLDITPSEEGGGMINFEKSTTTSFPVIVDLPEEKLDPMPQDNQILQDKQIPQDPKEITKNIFWLISWFIFVVILIVILIILIAHFIIKKREKSVLIKSIKDANDESNSFE